MSSVNKKVVKATKAFALALCCTSVQKNYDLIAQSSVNTEAFSSVIAAVTRQTPLNSLFYDKMVPAKKMDDSRRMLTK